MTKRTYSFSTRLSLYLVIVIGLVFVCSYLFFYYAARRSVSNEAFAHSHGEIKNTGEAIESALRQVECAVENAAILAKKSSQTPESYFDLLEAMVVSNPIIIGASIAFEPDYYPEYGYYYMPYVSRTGDTIKRQFLGGDKYDYHCMDWYLIPKLLNRNYWSEPYFDQGGGEVVMTTYTHLLTDSNSKTYGVLTADVALAEFTRMVESMKPYERSYSFMLSRNGYYLSHQKKERILNETVFSATKEMTDTTVVHIGRQMIAGRSDVQLLNNDDTISYVFYAPIVDTGWSIASVIPRDEILRGLNTMSVKVMWGAVLGLITLFILAVLVIRKVASPLPLFSKSAHLIASGNFDAALPAISTKDELKELHDSFEYMQTSLKNYVAELEVATTHKQHIESELQIARTIQLGMVPKIFPPFPNRDDIDLYAVLRPAKEVGGDLYDFFVNGDKLYFVIGDVSGKGVPASLLMAVTRSLFRSATSLCGANPKEVVENINHSLSETNEANMFVTLFVGILNLASGRLDYCNAGHNPPVIITGQQMAFMKTIVNIPVGVFDGYSYQSSFCELQRGDSIFLYTDGVTEAQNTTNQLYGEEKLLLELKESGQKTPQECVFDIVKSVTDFEEGGEPHDDVTILAMRYSAPELKFTLMNELPCIQIVADAVKSLKDRWNVPASQIMHLQLAIEEALVNVISYAYPAGETGEIELSMLKIDGSIVIEISDRGIAFDPTQVADVDISASAEERGIGGLGIHLLKNLMDEVTYARQGAFNRLTLKKKIAWM